MIWRKRAVSGCLGWVSTSSARPSSAIEPSPVLDGQPPDNLQHLADKFRIEGGSGFVEQQNTRPGSERAGDRHSLLLPTRKMAR
jgi:hypothetical protein